LVKKVGVPIQKENEATFGLEVRGEVNGEEVSSSSSDSGVWESVVTNELFQRGPGQKRPGFYCNLISVDRLC